MKRFREYEPNQTLLLPPSLQEWLPSDHLVHFIDEVVEELDLSDIYESYREDRGYPPYEPKMMVKVWLYAYCVGIRSSRKVERALQEHVGFRFLAANQQPKYWALNDFRSRHAEALGAFFEQSVHMADRAGLIKLNQVAIDGTKVKANASKHSAMSYGRMSSEESRLREEIEQYFRECDETDANEDKRYGDQRGDELPEHLNTKEKRLEAIRKAKRELEEEARQKAAKEQEERRNDAEAEGRTFHPRKDPKEVKPPAKAQRNFTDSDSRIMVNSDKAFIQAYNAQLAVDAQTQIAVATELTNQANDGCHLPGLLDQVVANTGRTPKEVSADAIYFNRNNLEAIKRLNAEAFIPPEKVTHTKWRNAKAPRGRIPKNATEEYLMWRKLRTKRGRERYKLRQTSVEPAFGQIKAGRDLRQVLHRGIERVRAFWRLDVAVHNLLKIYRSGGLRPTHT